MPVAAIPGRRHNHPVLPWLAQTQAPDASDWNITTSIAAAAALISFLTLVVTTVSTAKREDRKWAREALSQAFYDLIDASDKYTDAMGEYQDILWDGVPGAPHDDAYGKMEAAELAYRQANTRIRLLAPGSTVERAEGLQGELSSIRDALSRTMPRAKHLENIEAVMSAQDALVRKAKTDMSLPQ
jgi:hypothetical protein